MKIHPRRIRSVMYSGEVVPSSSTSWFYIPPGRESEVLTLAHKVNFQVWQKSRCPDKSHVLKYWGNSDFFPPGLESCRSEKNYLCLYSCMIMHMFCLKGTLYILSNMSFNLALRHFYSSPSLDRTPTWEPWSTRATAWCRGSSPRGT